MSTKLTITIDPAIIGSAKQYARTRGRSLSNLIEDYLRALVEEQKAGTEHKNIEPASKARRLYGILAPLAGDFDYRQTLEEELLKKHV